MPVMSTSGFEVGQKMALGYGATYPTVPGGEEQYEVVTVTAVGKPGTQAYLAADAPAGATNIKVTSVADISVGDKIRLDIDSVGHGIETVTVASVGTQAIHTNLSANASAGATNIKVRNVNGFAVGDKVTVGTPANNEVVSINAVGTPGPNGSGIDFTPALAQAHINAESVVAPGTGLDLAAPLKFNHAANLPFSDRGTGISFEPATAFAHTSNEPVQALGTGITLDKPLANGHAINAVVRDVAVTTAGYQGTPAPNQWFGGPELATSSPLFGRTINVREGSIVLRDASGLVVDSLNYGGLVDPWAAEGYQAASGMEQSGCYVPAPGQAAGFGPAAAAGTTNSSAGRFPDGVDTGSNCNDFRTQAATALPVASAAGTTNFKVSSVAGFEAGQTVMIDTGANRRMLSSRRWAPRARRRCALLLPRARPSSLSPAYWLQQKQTITIDTSANSETAVVATISRFPAPAITVATPLTYAHEADAQVSGTGITLTAPLTRAHAGGTQVTDSIPTPGAHPTGITGHVSFRAQCEVELMPGAPEGIPSAPHLFSDAHIAPMNGPSTMAS